MRVIIRPTLPGWMARRRRSALEQVGSYHGPLSLTFRLQLICCGLLWRDVRAPFFHLAFRRAGGAK